MSRLPSEKGNDPRSLILKITLIGVFSGLSFVMGAFLQIPYPGGGYFSFGDVAIVLSSLILGPIEGACVGMLSGSMSDWFGGYLNFLPWTILGKAFLGGIPGLMLSVFRGKKTLRFLGVFLGGLSMVGVYALSYSIFFGNAFGLATLLDLVQALCSGAIGVLVFLVLEKTKILSRLGFD